MELNILQDFDKFAAKKMEGRNGQESKAMGGSKTKILPLAKDDDKMHPKKNNKAKKND